MPMLLPNIILVCQTAAESAKLKSSEVVGQTATQAPARSFSALLIQRPSDRLTLSPSPSDVVRDIPITKKYREA